MTIYFLSGKKLSAYLRLMRLDKPIGSLLLLWPTLWALYLASNGPPRMYLLAVFGVGTVLMRSAGCVINDVADRHFDKHVARTAKRPVTTGEISVKAALLLFSGLILAAFVLIIPLRSPLFLGLACCAVFLAVSYPYTKRFLAIPQAYLGIAFGFGIPMAYAAVQHRVPLEAWVLLLANVFWAIAYDTEYAMVDREDDLKIGIRTSAISFGRYDVAMVMLCYALTLLLMTGLGVYLGRGLYFYAGIGAAFGMALYQYYLIRERHAASCFQAFCHNNWLGASLFVGIALDFF